MCVSRTEPIEDKPIIVDCTFLCAESPEDEAWLMLGASIKQLQEKHLTKIINYVCAKGNLDRVGGPKVQVIIPDPTLHKMFALWVEEGKASLKGGEAK